MTDLLLAVVSSVLISLVMRLSQRRVRNNVTMLAANYVVCMTLAALFTGEAGLVPNAPGMGAALGLGAVSGVLYLGGFLLLQWNIRQNGVALPATFMKLGVLVPTVAAVVLFGETPQPLQVAGVVLALGAIAIIGSDPGRGEARSVAGLMALLLMGGLADVMAKVYERVGSAALQSHYLLYTFASAFVLCVAVCVWKRQSVSWPDVLYGALIAIPNYFSARFLLLSLRSVPAVVAYPTFSVSTIVAVTLAGLALFGERLTRRQWIAMGVIVAALALMNL